MPLPTALQNTCILETPSALINGAFRFAKDNIARCMRYYSLGWGMSNSPHNSTIVVGRDTGWMCLGADYVAPWFAPAALAVFRDRQKPNGQIIEYVDLETGAWSDYGLNVADNTPHYLWAVWHHWRQTGDEEFRASYFDSVCRAADNLVSEMRPSGLLHAVPAGTATEGTAGWRNIIPGYVQAGEVTEINALSAQALRFAAELTGDQEYSLAAERIANAVEQCLWSDGYYLVNHYEDRANRQITGDGVFPLICGVATQAHARAVLDRLSRADFWSERGLRTVPNGDPGYDPAAAAGLVGGSWPNLTLWYAAAIAPYDPDRAIRTLEIVAAPVVEPEDRRINVRYTEFPEYFHGDTGVNLGMHLSPWVAPTFLWAVMEGLLGATWDAGRPAFAPRWPSGWESVTIRNLPTRTGLQDYTLRRK